jgi:hypothetical protein
MKKLLIVMAVFAGAALLVRRLVAGCGRIDWEQKFAAMPDNAPPKWMFTNIGAIRENTERIIDLLEPSPGESRGVPGDTSGGAT